MNRNILWLQGSEMDNQLVQNRINAIHDSRIPEKVLKKNIVAKFHTFYEENEYCALGSDWFLIYRVEDNNVFIEFIESLNSNEEVFERGIEMLDVFKKLLLTYLDYNFFAYLNSFSRPFYELAISKGLILEIENENNEVKFKVQPRFKLKTDYKKLKFWRIYETK